MEIKRIEDHTFFTELNFAEFVKDSILETKYQEVGIYFNPFLISREFISAIDNNDKIVIACLDGDKIIAILLGCKTSIIFSDTPIAEQKYVRVDESSRGNGIYKKMLDEFCKWAKEKECKMVVVGSHYHTGSAMLADIIHERRLKPFHSSCFIEV